MCMCTCTHAQLSPKVNYLVLDFFYLFSDYLEFKILHVASYLSHPYFERKLWLKTVENVYVVQASMKMACNLRQVALVCDILYSYTFKMQT